VGARTHEFRLGDLRCAVVSDGAAAAPLQLFFNPEGGVSEEALREGVAEEGSGRSTTAVNYNCLVVHAGSGDVLVDTGLGEEFLGYGREVGALLGKLRPGLAAAGASPERVRTVVFTHLHQDHVRGAVWPGVPAFADAEHVATAAEIAFWTSAPAGAEADQARTALTTLGASMRSVGFDDAITPEIRCVDASGHTPGHMALLIGSGGQRMLCAGDLFYDRLQLRHPEWTTAYDVDRPASVAARRRLAGWAADEDVAVLAYHMPFPGLGRIRRRGDAFDWEPIP
jgi:glyoxylase-like metal-dependent hydrolase (beta-lactamase superfamily II)